MVISGRIPIEADAQRQVLLGADATGCGVPHVDALVHGLLHQGHVQAVLYPLFVVRTRNAKPSLEQGRLNINPDTVSLHEDRPVLASERTAGLVQTLELDLAALRQVIHELLGSEAVTPVLPRAALRNFESYGGRAKDKEDQTKGLIGEIEEGLNHD